MKHPGTPNLYDMSKPVAEGGLTSAPASAWSATATTCWPKASTRSGSEIQDGYPEFTMQMLMDLGWDGDLTDDERAAIEPSPGPEDQLEDRPFGRHPAGRHQAWLRALRQRQGPRGGLDLPGPGADPPRAALHQPPRSGGGLPDLRGPQVLSSADAVRVDPEEGLLRDYPIILTSGRLVEYEGGGDETRSNPWLAELQQDMFVEINPRDANNLGMRDGARSGSKARKAARSRSWPWSPNGSARAWPSCRSTSAAFPGRGPAVEIPRRRRPLCAGRSHQHRADLWLRLGDPDAGDQSHSLQDHARKEED
jgi:formate dehydrogenase major subunit